MLSAKVLLIRRSTSKEDSIFVSLNFTQESSFSFKNAEEEIIFESRLENSIFFELSASSEKSKILFSSKNSKHIFFETKNIFSKALFFDQKKKFDKSKKLSILSSQISLENYDLTHQTSLRVQSINQISRVQSKIHFFQFFHLTNLRKLFINRFFIVFTIISSETIIRSNANTVLSEEYFANAFLIVFRQYNIQSLQELIQRNFDFLESILFRVINSQFESVESFSDYTSQNLSNSTSASFESNWEENSSNNITTQKKIVSFIFFTTSLWKNQVNSFFSSSILSFDFLFHQFRSSFSSDSFISSVRSISLLRFLRLLQCEYRYIRINQQIDRWFCNHRFYSSI